MFGGLSIKAAEVALTRKYAGIPGYIFAAAAVLAGALLLPRLHLLTGSSAVGVSDTAGGYTGSGSTGPTGQPASDPGAAGGLSWGHGAPTVEAPPAGAANVSGGTSFASAPPPPPTAAPPPPAAPRPNPNPPYPGAAAPLPSNDASGSTTSYTPGPGGVTGFVGGPAPTGSLTADDWEDHHRFLRRPTMYPQFVRSSGSTRTHLAEIMRIAAQAGIHPARLIALNPYPTGLIRVA